MTIFMQKSDAWNVAFVIALWKTPKVLFDDRKVTCCIIKQLFLLNFVPLLQHIKPQPGSNLAHGERAPLEGEYPEETGVIRIFNLEIRNASWPDVGQYGCVMIHNLSPDFDKTLRYNLGSLHFKPSQQQQPSSQQSELELSPTFANFLTSFSSLRVDINERGQSSRPQVGKGEQ